jgi:hypothetical protein
VGQILESKGNLTSYCQEVARELGMEYKAPLLPVEVKYTKDEPASTTTNPTGMDSNMTGHDEHKRERDKEEEALVKGFQFMARQRHRLTTC